MSTSRILSHVEKEEHLQVDLAGALSKFGNEEPWELFTLLKTRMVIMSS